MFPEDPLPGSTGQFIYNAFMQLDDISPCNLHTGVDIAASVGDPVYPPVEPDVVCLVSLLDYENNFVGLVPQDRQEGDYVGCLMAHVEPSEGLTIGTQVYHGTCIGEIDDLAHLHFELFLSPDNTMTDADLRSPRRHSLCNAAWNADSTPPVITHNTVVHTAPVGSPSVWQIWAADPIEEGDPPIYNGIGGMQLLIDDVVVDEFDFEAMAAKDGGYPPAASEFYYDLTPPSGNNNPNTLQYKLSWVATDDLEHVWRLRWWDAMENSDEGDPENPPVVPLLAGEIGGDIWFESGIARTSIRWRVSCLGEIDHFDVLRSRDSAGSYTQVNLEPILAMDGQLDYKFVDSLPEGWTSVWYRLAADDAYGNSYEIGRAHLAAEIPAAAGLSLYPNPSPGVFFLQVDTPRDCTGSLAVYDVAGRRVRTLHEGNLGSGTRLWTWDGRDACGGPVGQGVYFVRFATEDEVIVQKLVLIR